MKTLQQQVNTLLSLCDLNPTLDGILFTSPVLCILRLEEHDQHRQKSNIGGVGVQQEQMRAEASISAGSNSPSSTTKYTQGQNEGHVAS